MRNKSYRRGYGVISFLVCKPAEGVSLCQSEIPVRRQERIPDGVQDHEGIHQFTHLCGHYHGWFF